MTGPDHPRFSDDVAAYLLGALDEGEARDFEAHMEGCPDCRRELEHLRPAADALPRSVEQMEPPPALKRSLMDVVEAEARERDPARGGRVLASTTPRPAPATGGLRVVMAVTLLAIGLAVGFEVSELSRTAPAWSARGREGGQEAGAPGPREPAVRGQRSARRRAAHPGPAGAGRGIACTRRGSSATGASCPQPTFMVGSDGQGTVALPDDLSKASAVLVTRERSRRRPAAHENPILSVPL